MSSNPTAPNTPMKQTACLIPVFMVVGFGVKDVLGMFARMVSRSRGILSIASALHLGIWNIFCRAAFIPRLEERKEEDDDEFDVDMDFDGLAL